MTSFAQDNAPRDEKETSSSPRVIRSARDLPKTFDLRKYEPLKNLDLVQWALQLAPRVMIYFMLTSPDPERDPDDDSKFNERQRKQRDDLANFSAALLESPIIPPREGNHNNGHLAAWRSHLEGSPFDTYTVRAMQGSWAYRMAQEISSGMPIWKPIVAATDAVDQDGGTQAEREIAATPIDLIYRNAGINIEGTTHIEVDLAATDEQIIADFSRFLPSYRKRLGIKVRAQSLTEKDFATWVAAGVIPFIDLQIWALAENCSITQNTLGQAIFPDVYDTDTTERIRRTTRPKADQILTPSFLDALNMQVNAYLLAQENPA